MFIYTVTRHIIADTTVCYVIHTLNNDKVKFINFVTLKA